MGLIGSSLSRAIYKNHLAINVYGIDINEDVVKKCEELNLLVKIDTNINKYKHGFQANWFRFLIHWFWLLVPETTIKIRFTGYCFRSLVPMTKVKNGAIIAFKHYFTRVVSAPP